VSERDPAALAAGDELGSFCAASDTALIGVQDLIAFRELTEQLTVTCGAIGAR
jgi:hypothetical protein